MTKELLDYFKGDELASQVWMDKYQLKDSKGAPLEDTPDDMHHRLAKEFARIENKYKESELEKGHENLSSYGKFLYGKREEQFNDEVEEEIFNYFKNFKWIIPQGSIMSILGNSFKTGSLSNCFVIPNPYDSYGGILKTDEQLVQLMKRRGGVGTNLSTLRPNKTTVSNAAGSSTGAPSFMHRYSNSTREVAQDGRRGALMLLLHCLHPDIFDFVKIKKDRTKVTGANVSVLLTDKFMEAADKDKDFICRFPININIDFLDELPDNYEYNKIYEIEDEEGIRKNQYAMKIHAKELYDLIVEMAWENAEPGQAFIDRIINFSPDGVYEMFKAIASNPCGEQWLPAYDSCRLFASNLFSMVDNPFTKEAVLNLNKVYEVFYMQQRYADDLIDLEIEHIEAILLKIEKDPEPDDVKRVERELWENVLKITKAGRRTGCGFTGLGDMLAALNLKYDSAEAIDTINALMKIKMEAELDCTIDLSILRGSFEGFDKDKEFTFVTGEFDTLYNYPYKWTNIQNIRGNNDFYQMLVEEFPNQVERMYQFARRNVSWSTVAPTGTVSLMTQTTSGIEPLFLPFYMRRKKVNPSDKDARVDFVDANGDNWQEFAVLHPKFKDWLMQFDDWMDINQLSKDALQKHFENSPWYKSTANDIFWENRIHIQSIIQKYTTNAISSTINLPNDVSKEEVSAIYKMAWKMGLKGVTVYRDGCRDGVLVSEKVVKEVAFSPKDAVKRPHCLDCEIHTVTVKGIPYIVMVSMLENNPYEVFVIPNGNSDIKNGRIVKAKKGKYDLLDLEGFVRIENIGDHVTDEESAIARLVSTSLRHGTDVKFLVDQLNKSHGPIVGFSKAIARCLKKYVKDEKIVGKTCGECGSENLVREEGCLKCLDCGNSKCG